MSRSQTESSFLGVSCFLDDAGVLTLVEGKPLRSFEKDTGGEGEREVCRRLGSSVRRMSFITCKDDEQLGVGLDCSLNDGDKERDDCPCSFVVVGFGIRDTSVRL